MNKPVFKWSPAHPIRAKDNIISAVAIEKNQLGFKPTYEDESKQYMNFLMSHEYMRMWFKERRQYEKDVYSREETIKEESKIKRRVVQRMMTYRRPLRNDFIDDLIQKKKGKQDVEPAITIEKMEKMKFKPECHHYHHKKGGEAKSQEKSEDAKEQKSTKGVKKLKEPTKKSKKEEEDECDGDDAEILLVSVDNADDEKKECCKCEDKK